MNHPTDFDPQSEHRLITILASFAEFENQRRAEALMRAKRHRAATGRAVSRPPTGYIVIKKGHWGKDPAVSAQIAEVFHLYRALGSVRKVVQALAAKACTMPSRTPAGELRWVRPTRARIYAILTNPAFMGWYVFGRYTHVQGAPRGMRRQTAWEERVVVRNHHDPYVTPEVWHQINQQLRRRAGRGRQQTPPQPPPPQGDDEAGDRAALRAGEDRTGGAEAIRVAGTSFHNLNKEETNE